MVVGGACSLTLDKPPAGFLELDVSSDPQSRLLVGHSGDAVPAGHEERVAVWDVVVHHL